MDVRCTRARAVRNYNDGARFHSACVRASRKCHIWRGFTAGFDDQRTRRCGNYCSRGFIRLMEQCSRGSINGGQGGERGRSGCAPVRCSFKTAFEHDSVQFSSAWLGAQSTIRLITTQTGNRPTSVELQPTPRWRCQRDTYCR